MAFYPCTADMLDSFINDTLTDLYSEVTSIRQTICQSATSLVSVDMPNLTEIPQSAFRNCTSLININIPNVTKLNGTAFYGSDKIEIIDFPKLNSIIGTNNFYYCNKIATLIFRGNSVVVNSESSVVSTAWGQTPFGAGKAGGKIYVPQSLVSAYEADSYWSQVIALNPLNQILAIEGSPYEN